MFRKSSLKIIGGYREVAKIENTSLCEDFDLWKRIAKIGQLVNLEKELTFYRQHPSQLSRKFRYAQELASIYVEGDLFDKTGIKFEIVQLGHINSEAEIRKSIYSMSRKQKWRFHIYSRLIRNDLKLKKLQSLLGITCIKLLNAIS
jgi:hypothetical protein